MATNSITHAVQQQKSINVTLADGSTRPLRLYAYQRLTKNRQTRLLQLLPTKAKTQEGHPIPHCEVEIHDLDHAPSFTTISYVWGDLKHARAVRINDNEQISISIALFEVLSQLSTAISEPQWFWADQISINQADLAERASQVASMGDIFAQAESTRVWLGNGQDQAGNDVAFDCIEWITGCLDKHIRAIDSTHISSDTDQHSRALKMLKHIPKTKADLEAMLDDTRNAYAGPARHPTYVSHWTASTSKLSQVGPLLSHPWFNRQWTLLEAVKSQNLYFCAGHRKCTAVEMHVTTKVFSALYWSHLQATTHLDNALIIRQELGNDNSSLFTLLRHASRNTYKCTDEKDRIFSLLPLQSPSLRCKISVDYTKTYEQLSREATLAMIKQNGALDMLHVFMINTDVTLPSWVPAWTIGNTMQLIYLPNSKYNACADMVCEPEEEDGVLTVRGRVLAKIFYTYEPVFTLFPNESVKNHFDRQRSDVLFVDPDTTSLTLIKRHLDCRRAALQNQSDWSLQCIDMIERTLSTGRSYSNEETVSSLNIAIRGSLDMPYVGMGMYRSNYYQISFHRRTAMLYSNSFPLALVPNTAKAGDSICVLEGSHVPILLRSSDDGTWRNLGGCYVDGAMYGEFVNWKQGSGDMFRLS